MTDTTTLIERARELVRAGYAQGHTAWMLDALAAALASTVAERDAAYTQLRAMREAIVEIRAALDAGKPHTAHNLARAAAERDAANKRLAEYVHDYDDVVEELGTAEAERDAAYTQRDTMREALEALIAVADAAGACTIDARRALAATAEDGTT